MALSSRLAWLVAVLAVGCGRSSLFGVDTGCPPGAHCVSDGGLDGGGDGFNQDGFNQDGFNQDGFNQDGFNQDGGRPDLDFNRDGGCAPVETCNNGIDDDCNGLTDCADPACAPLPFCLRKELCNNGVDDDGNGLVDCADPACFGAPNCITPGKEICNNGIDDNDNKLIDCADPECFGSPVCKPPPGPEICNNGLDDNGDGLIDCADPQCVNFPACIIAVCAPDTDFGSINPHDSTSTRTMSTVGASKSFRTCAVPGGTARVGVFTLTGAADVKADFTQATGGAHVVALFRAGTGQTCDQNPLNCWNVGQAATGTRTYPALSAGTYYVIVQSYPGTQSSTTLTLSTSPSAKVEICNNGVDDDGNGLIDCADLACVNAPNCLNKECLPDINLGSLVIDGPSKSATAVTTTSSNRFHPTCAGLSTGNDVTVSFSLPGTAGILVQWTQTGDHAFGLFVFPPAGQACDAIQTSCYYPGGVNGGTVAFQARPAGKYVFVFKAISPAAQGTVNVQISAFSNRQQEICTNGIDDDGNGLTDCADPACIGVPACAAPLCVPDVDLGDFTFGTQQSTTVNTLNAQNLYNTTCSKGTGKERVVRVNLTQPMALGINCSDTGSHVLQLSQQVQPLDACDAHNFNCADPSILPFGCNFAMPNLQPGRYNLIVDAFAAGSEGTVNLTLTGIQEKVLEICNNGIDDDGDGKIDCQDLKCVTSQLCRQLACRADQKIGILPLDGSLKSVVVQTTGAGDDQKNTACVTATGGQDAVVDFELPAKADVTLDWAQVGTHALALYTNANDLLACDAGTAVSCTPTSTQTGMVLLPALAAGKYHLVVDAMKPGQEGGVVIQLTGVPSP